MPPRRQARSSARVLAPPGPVVSPTAAPVSPSSPDLRHARPASPLPVPSRLDLERGSFR
jgi:hypothetical protein